MDGESPRQKHRILVGRELKYRIVWLVYLRYAAVASILVAVYGAKAILGISVPQLPVLVTTAALLLYNGVLHTVVHRVRFSNWYTAGYYIASVQVFTDLVFLTALIHLTGGIDNPLVFFYVFHGIIAAILLSRRAAFLQATAAVALLATMVILEHLGILPHVHLAGFDAHVEGLPATAAILSTVATTLYLAVYMTLSLSRELRAREERCLDANEQLHEQDRLKSEYVRLIAHDLKEPLAAIASTLRVALDGYAGELPPKARELVERAEDRTLALIRLIREMLDLSRMRSQADLERAHFPFRDMVAAVVQELEPNAVKKGQTLELSLPSDPFLVLANRMALEQVFQNLVGNAIKYTPEGGRVYVQLRDTGAALEARVGDSGIGIPKEALPRVFDEFYRAPNAKRLTREGTGLGLAFVRAIVTAYDGKVRVESPWTPLPGAPPTGTLFTVTFGWHGLRPDESGAAPPAGPPPGAP